MRKENDQSPRERNDGQSRPDDILSRYHPVAIKAVIAALSFTTSSSQPQKRRPLASSHSTRVGETD